MSRSHLAFFGRLLSALALAFLAGLAYANCICDNKCRMRLNYFNNNVQNGVTTPECYLTDHLTCNYCVAANACCPSAGDTPNMNNPCKDQYFPVIVNGQAVKITMPLGVANVTSQVSNCQALCTVVPNNTLVEGSYTNNQGFSPVYVYGTRNVRTCNLADQS